MAINSYVIKPQKSHATTGMENEIMKVKKLIAELNKMPQNLEVVYSAHDNAEHEIGGDICSVFIFDKNDIPCPEWISTESRQWYNDQPAKAVVIHG